jgi:hypothetical protein
MIWATNYTRLLSHTVWTLFFAGKAFAPKCIIDGMNIQDWLQEKFINAVSVLAERIAQEGGLLDEVVIGWDSMNEPGDGLVGYEDLSVVPKDQRLKKGPTPTAFDGMKLGMGQAVEVDVWEFTQMGPKNGGRVVMDPKGVKLWLKPEEEATRGGGKWGWKRSDEWKLGACSTSAALGSAGTNSSLGAARCMGPGHLEAPSTRLLPLQSRRPRNGRQHDDRLLASALAVIRLADQEVPSRINSFRSTARVRRPARAAPIVHQEPDGHCAALL